MVTGLLLIGLAATEDGLFAAAADWMARLPGGAPTLFVASMLLVAIVTAVLNLDTSVAFLTPVLVQLARLRQTSEDRFLYGCVFMSNSASLLLPGSNLTNLLVLADEHISGSLFFIRMLLPWLTAVLVTTAVVSACFRAKDVHGESAVIGAVAPAPLSIAGIAVAAAFILLLADSALPVFAVGLILAGSQLARRRMDLGRTRAVVDVLSLLSVFLVAVSLGTLARTWAFPAQLMMGLNAPATAAVGAVAAVFMNNLPAAVLLGSQMPAHPRALLLGLNIGPNLAVSGSLSALIWWQAARSVGARPSVKRYSAVGLVLAPITIVAALAVSGNF